MKKLLALCLLPFGAFALTPIADTVYTASGATAAVGSYLIIKWPRFTSSGSHVVPPNVQRVPLANGTFLVSLESTATAQFPFHYTVEYHLVSAGQELPPYTETWDVPDTATPQRIANVVVVTPAPLPSPTAKGDLAASDGVSTVWLPAPAASGYVLQTDPTQPTGLAYASITSLGSNFDLAGAAATAQSNAKTYTDASIAGLSSVYDQAGTAAAVQAAFQTSLSNTIATLNLGSASAHSASDFDPAGAASAAQAAAKAYTDSTVAGSGVTSSYVSNAITSAIAGLNLLSASQHAASDFDPAGTASAAIAVLNLKNASQHAATDFDAAGTASSAIAAIPSSGSSQTSPALITPTDWAIFNGKQNAIPANTYDAYGAAATAQANAISTAQTNANTAIAALNLKSASQHLSTDFDAAGVAASAVAAIPNSGSLQTKAALITPVDWTTFNNKQPALGFTPLNAANNLSDVASASQARTNLGLGSAATQSASAFDPAGAAAAVAVTAAPPYMQIGTNLYLTADHMSLASKPPASGLSFLPSTGNSPNLGPVYGANGDLMIGDINAGPFYYGKSATTSVEAVIAVTSSPGGAYQTGLYMWDSGNNKLYRFVTETSSSYPSGSSNYNGSAAPGGFANLANYYLPTTQIFHLKLSVSGGVYTFAISTDGGQYFRTLLTGGSGIVVGSMGIYVNALTIDVLSLNIQ